MNVFKIIENEIESYINGDVEISPGYRFSTYKTIKRIMLFLNGHYESGKLDSQGNYKYWFDVTNTAIDAEVKNIDFDTKNVETISDNEDDATAVFISNGRLKEWMNETEQGVVLNDSVEEFSGMGNIIWKKVKGSYEICDPKNTYVINQTAKYIKDSPVVERHIMTQSDLRAKKGIWDSIVIDEVIKECQMTEYATTEDGAEGEEQEIPYYEIHERNGEISEKDLNEAQGKEGGSEDNYLMAKIVAAGINTGKEDKKKVLYADKITEFPFKSAHRGKYTRRFWRKGIVEILFDVQVRANEIGNQIARGLEYASRQVFESPDRLVVQNIFTDLQRGDVIKTQGLKQVEMRIQGLDQLIADWNRLIQLRDSLCNSYEIVTGESMPSGTPFRMGAILNTNASKFFVFIRQKLALGFKEVIEDWVLPDLLKDLKASDVLRITGDSDYLKQFKKVLVDGWYVKNLVNLPPHTKEMADMLKEQKLKEIEDKKEIFLQMEEDFWANFKPRARIIIDGEGVNLSKELQNLATFIGLEMDPVRRTALIERAMAKSGIDISTLPKSEPNQMNMAPATNAVKPDMMALAGNPGEQTV